MFLSRESGGPSGALGHLGAGGRAAGVGASGPGAERGSLRAGGLGPGEAAESLGVEAPALQTHADGLRARQ